MEKDLIDEYFCEEWQTHFFNTITKYPICWERLGANRNITMKIIKDNIGKPWLLSSICNNRNITIEFLREYENKELHGQTLDWNVLSSNRRLTLDMLRAFPDKRWDWKQISDNYCLTIEWLIEFPDKPWNWKDITKHRNITVEHIQQYPNFPWVTEELCWNKNMTLELALENHIKWSWNKIEWNILCFNNNLPIEIILEKQNMTVFDKDGKYITPWKWNWLSKNKHLTMKIVKNNLDKNWNWYDITLNANISLDDILANPDYPWDLNVLCIKDGIDMNFIVSHPPEFFKNRLSGKSWNTEYVSSYLGTVKNIKKYPDYPWDFDSICNSYLLTIGHLLEFPDKQFNWSAISDSCNLTFEMLRKFPDKPWDWNAVVEIDFFDDSFDFVKQRIFSLKLVAIYDFYQNPLLYTNCYTGFATSIEYVFCNDYLVQNVAKY
jgi:hypothetical protein